MNGLIELAALIALDGPAASIDRAVGASLAAGASAEEVTDVLVIIARTVGGARTVAAAPRVAAALGYDVEAAFEAVDPPSTPQDV